MAKKKRTKGGKQATSNKSAPRNPSAKSQSSTGQELPDTVQLDRKDVMKAVMSNLAEPSSAQGDGKDGDVNGPGTSGPPPEGTGGFAAHIGAKLLLLVSAIFGLGVSIRVTLRHLDLKYGEAAEDALCTINEQFNCNEVLNSDYAAIGSLPISLPQFANFLVILMWVLVLFVGNQRIKKAAASYAFGMGFLSVLVSVFLIFISKTQIGALCPYCMMLYTANLGVLIGGIWALGWKPGPAFASLFTAITMVPMLLGSAGMWAGTVGGSYAVYNGQKTKLIAEQISRADAKIDKQKATASSTNKASGQSTGEGKFPIVSENDPFTGPADAEVVVVEFADFQCGYCKRLSYSLKQVKEEYGDQVKFVFKHFPMNTACNPHVKNDRHPYACGASMAAECAQAQGKFWEYHDLLFKNNHRLRASDLKHYAEELSLDMGSFEQCMRDPKTRERLQEDMDEANRLDIHGTPRTYIAGEELRGVRPPEFLANRLSKALGEQKSRIARSNTNVAAARTATKAAPESVSIKVGNLDFKIDSFEASLGSDGKAQSEAGKVPKTRASWYDAKEACEAAGKRLCTAEEWMTACTGEVPIDNDRDGKLTDDYIEGNEYPYGPAFQDGRCHVTGDADKSKVTKTGQFARCKTESGVYDMTGNAAEWVGATEDEAMLMGGGFIHQDKAKCWKAQETFGPGWAQRYSGIRCCE